MAPGDEPPVLTPTETPPTVMVVPTGTGTDGVGTDTVVEPPLEVTVGRHRAPSVWSPVTR